MESDFDYYTRRLREERQAVETATDEGIRRAHATMADTYAAKLQGMRDAGPA